MRHFILIAAALCLTTATLRAQDKSADLAVVVNPANSLSDVSSGDLAKIFKADKGKTPEGVKYSLATRDSGSPERNAALAGIYKMSDAEYEKFFLQATFAGTVPAAPKSLNSGGAVLQFVAGNPGGICYVRGSEADGTVKVLKVDGKAPGDAGYPLKIK